MADTTYKCNSGSIKAFPLTITGRPTRNDYTTGVDSLEGLIDLQWAPIKSGLITSTSTVSTTGSIYLEQNESTSTVIFNTLKYTILNVQITKSQHTSWLIDSYTGNPNTEDLVILLQGASPTTQDPIYMIFVLPLLTNGLAATDPAYLKNINNSTATGEGIQSCFPKKGTAATDLVPLFAHYVTCFDGYTTHAHTQTVPVFVSTVGTSVSAATMTKIKGTITTIGTIELPSIIVNSYYKVPTSSGIRTQAERVALGGSEIYRGQGGLTQISIQDFPHYITTTSFTTDLSNIANQHTTRTDSTNAYQCVELDPDTVDTNQNIHIDLKTGQIASTTLDDILAERAIVKQMVNPDEAINSNSKTGRETAAFFLVLIVIVSVFACLYFFIFQSDNTPAGSFRYLSELGASGIIGALFICAAGMWFFGKGEDMKNNTYIVGGVAAGLGLLFYLIYFIAWPPPLTTECQKTTNSLAGTTSLAQAVANPAAVAASVSPAAGETGWPAFYNSFKGRAVQVGVTGAIFGLLGFIIGNII